MSRLGWPLLATVATNDIISEADTHIIRFKHLKVMSLLQYANVQKMKTLRCP